MLQPRQTFTLNGLDWRVAHVNSSRAHCVATSTKPVTVTDSKTGAVRTFTATIGRTMDISAETPLALLREFGL